MAELKGTVEKNKELKGSATKTGPRGPAGISPTITKDNIDGGYRLTIKDVNGEDSIDLMNGKDGQDGKTAYAYAQDGGYAGKENEFIKKLATDYMPLSGGKFEGDVSFADNAMLLMRTQQGAGEKVHVTKQGILRAGYGYTNQLKLATDYDRTTAIGYKTGVRLSSSGAEATAETLCCSGFIPVSAGDILRVKNVTLRNANNNAVYVIAYDSDNVKTGYVQLSGESDTEFTVTLDSGTFGTTFNAVRFSAAVISDDTIATINEEIITDLEVPTNLPVTPQKYGARGDGVTDDTAALKKALKDNDAIYLPKGTYVISEPIDISDKKSLFSFNQEGIIHYIGSGSAFYVGRKTRINGIRVNIASTTVDHVFNTDNRIFPATMGELSTEINDIEVYFTGVATSYKTTIINIIASNKDYKGVSGFHNQHYSNIRVIGNAKVEYGIKICVQFDEYYERDVTGVLPWITNMRFNHIWLGTPEYAIKVYRQNNCGQALDYGNIVKTEQMMFTDISTQCSARGDSHSKIFYDVEWCFAEFINCQPWDYHHILDEGNKYNITGEGATISLINAKRSPIESSYFPSVTDRTPEEDPAYFMKKFFFHVSACDYGSYDTVDRKCEEYMNAIKDLIPDTAEIEAIAQTEAQSILTAGYTNVMEDPLTEVRVNQRFSGSGNAWVACDENDTLIIPIEPGMNIIRWKGNDLSPAYMGIQFSNDLVTMVYHSPSEWNQFIVTTESGEKYLPVNNTGAYKYCILPFLHTAETMNADNMIITINEIISKGVMNEVDQLISEKLEAVKESGEFDGPAGKDGTSVTVKSVSESTADGGDNVVTFSDGKSVTIKNGSKGSTGATGPEGPQGPKGDTGATGATGVDGKTPVKGTDYFTEADKKEMVNAVKAALTTENWVFTLEDGSTVTKAVLLG